MDCLVDEWIDGWTDGLVGGWMDEQKTESSDPCVTLLVSVGLCGLSVWAERPLVDIRFTAFLSSNPGKHCV